MQPTTQSTPDVDYFENIQLRADAILKEDRMLARMQRLERFAGSFLRYSLVLILFWIGGLKFTAYQAQALEPYVVGSPLLSWGYSIMSVRDFAALVGGVEILFGLMIALRPLSFRICIVGSVLTAGLFFVNLSFLITTPGVIEAGYSFPALSRLIGQFVVKDVTFLGVAIWSAAEAWKSLLLHRRHQRATRFGEPNSPFHSIQKSFLSA